MVQRDGGLQGCSLAPATAWWAARPTTRSATSERQLRCTGVTALHNGNYVVSSPLWDNGAASDAGAVTWCSGTVGCRGAISASNSLVGSTAGDQVGYDYYSDYAQYIAVTVLTNGNYVVGSPWWDNGAASDAGAVTWCSGTTGCTGAVSASNSLVGSSAGDQVSLAVSVASNAFFWNGVWGLPDGNYVVHSAIWDNGAATNAGAVTWCSGVAGCAGAITGDNSVMGAATNGGASLTFAYDSANDQLVVGRPADNRVTLFISPPTIITFEPTGGSVGTSVTITATDLTGATAVMFNGISASDFNVLSSTSLTATVPTSATTGPISVTTPRGTATSSSNFIVFYHTIALPLIRR